MNVNDPHFGYEFSTQVGSPYYLERTPIYDGNDNLCAAPPWGALVALNLTTRTLTFRTPLGTLVQGAHTGTVTIGGPIASAGGLVFTAGGSDKQFRAVAADTGNELWRATLPAAGRATPMTYVLHGRQYVVIAAGGHGGFSEDIGGHIVAYALP